VRLAASGRTYERKKFMKNRSILSEGDVLSVLHHALLEKVESKLSGYASPLDAVINSIIAEHETEIRNIINTALETALHSKSLIKSVNDEFQHKVAKSLVAKLEGTVERAVEKLRQDQTLRARMVLAIEQLIKDAEASA
jgi:hypothetical protein